MQQRSSVPPVIVTGDFNACPTSKSSYFGFDCFVYKQIKAHPLKLRSVLNDDLHDLRHSKVSKQPLSEGVVSQTGAIEDEVTWTTWKARQKQGKEFIVKHCIDYILYTGLESPATAQPGQLGIRAVATCDMFPDDEVAPELFPNAAYPSDHIALIADFDVVEVVKKP